MKSVHEGSHDSPSQFSVVRERSNAKFMKQIACAAGDHLAFKLLACSRTQISVLGLHNFALHISANTSSHSIAHTVSTCDARRHCAVCDWISSPSYKKNYTGDSLEVKVFSTEVLWDTCKVDSESYNGSVGSDRVEASFGVTWSTDTGNHVQSWHIRAVMPTSATPSPTRVHTAFPSVTPEVSLCSSVRNSGTYEMNTTT